MASVCPFKVVTVMLYRTMPAEGPWASFVRIRAATSIMWDIKDLLSFCKRGTRYEVHDSVYVGGNHLVWKGKV